MDAVIRTVDASDYLAWELPTLPYTVHAAPYGESLYREFATEAKAIAFAEDIESMTGTYGTSWGEAPVWTEVTVHHYVGEPADAAPIAPAPERGEDGEIDPEVFPSAYCAPMAAHTAARRDAWAGIALRVTAFGRVGLLSNSSLQLAPLYARKGA